MFDDKPSEVKRDRADFEKTFLRQVGVILRRDAEKDKVSSIKQGWYEITPAFKCGLLDADTNTEIEEGAKLVSIRNVKIKYAQGLDLRATDRIKIGENVFSIRSMPDKANALLPVVICTKV